MYMYMCIYTHSHKYMYEMDCDQGHTSKGYFQIWTQSPLTEVPLFLLHHPILYVKDLFKVKHSLDCRHCLVLYIALGYSLRMSKM